ncbi:helix-turn-helix transcriptional regulator [Myceligenerans sp. TRM 65318]|uniref:Helix-turn-helix transcriptional regulator n=1 Tax=Myceligenerans pegani TaxID=2776917 RepID=A0ABR9N113_9MICO|nr:helix-turn-helix transcriptional regulator [Myceligenerans sp. TRM 65318]MBE3019242.1 helix-turn-helix transcriptional regulator [Myceligenerans sp. TRM 65318]
MPVPRTTALSPRIREGRTALGARLRDLRRAAGMTGQQLADSLSWARSKVSKIENAYQPPTDDDVRSWCDVTNSADQVDSILAELHTLQTRHQEWQRVLRGGMASRQNAVARREEETQLFRGYGDRARPAADARVRRRDHGTGEQDLGTHGHRGGRGGPDAPPGDPARHVEAVPDRHHRGGPALQPLPSGRDGRPDRAAQGSHDAAERQTRHHPVRPADDRDAEASLRYPRRPARRRRDRIGAPAADPVRRGRGVRHRLRRAGALRRARRAGPRGAARRRGTGRRTRDRRATHRRETLRKFHTPPCRCN